MSVAGAGILTATLYVDGAAQNGQCVLTPVTAGIRATVAQNWLITIAPGSSGVTQLRAKKSINAGTAAANATHSTLTAIPLP
jgi:hypothetical protein